jgi:hypothetical protein
LTVDFADCADFFFGFAGDAFVDFVFEAAGTVDAVCVSGDDVVLELIGGLATFADQTGWFCRVSVVEVEVGDATSEAAAHADHGPTTNGDTAGDGAVGSNGCPFSDGGFEGFFVWVGWS